MSKIQIAGLHLCIICLFSNDSAHAQAPAEVSKQQVIAWKDKIKNGTFIERNGELLLFPGGTVSQELWETALLSEVNSTNVNMRIGLALLIGNKKLFPDASLKVLTKLLRDKSDSVAINAMYALASFGPKVIPLLLDLIRSKPPPYFCGFCYDENSIKIDSTFHTFYGYFLKYTDPQKLIAANPDLAESPYSRDAFRAVFCLRLLKDDLLPVLSSNYYLPPVYRLYLLDEISVSAREFPLYYKEFLKLQPLWKEDSFIKGQLEEELLFKKLSKDLPVDTVSKILRSISMDLSKEYLNFEKSVSKFKSPDIARVRSSLNLDSALLNNDDSLFVELNKMTVHKETFFRYKDEFTRLLTKKRSSKDSTRDFIYPTLIILSNIGDSAIPLEKEVLPLTLSKSPRIRYLAIKTVMNMHLSSNGGYTTLDPNYFKDDRLSHGRGMDVSNEFHEGNANGNMQMLVTKEILAQYHYDFFPEKIFLDHHLQQASGDMRSFTVNDTTLMHYCAIFSRDEDASVRLYVAYLLELADSLNEQVASLLLQLTQDKDEHVQYYAARSLSNFENQLSPSEKAFVHFVLMEHNFHEQLSNSIEHLTYTYDTYPLIYAKAGGIALSSLPVFTLPPPKPSLSGMIDLQIPQPNLNLFAVYDKLHIDLINNGYTDQRVFQLNDGFVLLTKIERIHEDGSIDFKNRWSTKKQSPASFHDYFTDLFFGEEGNFRGTLFIVSGKDNYQSFGKAFISNNDYSTLFDKGSYSMNGADSLSRMSFNGKNILVFIYAYHKKSNGEIGIAGDDGQAFLNHFASMKLKSFKLK